MSARLKKNYGFWFVGLIICFTITDVMGQSDNLLKNTEFNDVALSAPNQAVSGWMLTPATGWQQKEESAFLGMAFSLFYLEGQGPGILCQAPVSVQANTWYVLKSWFMAKPSSAVESHAFRLNAVKGDDPAGSLGGIEFGCSPQWNEARGFFFSGAETSVRFQASFSGTGTRAIGNCQLYAFGASEYRGPYLLDGSFEKSIPGNSPVDFVADPLKTLLEVVVEENGLAGKQCLRAKAVAGTGIAFKTGGLFPVRPGSRVRVSLWAKTEAGGTTVTNVLSRCGATNSWREQLDMSITEKWQAYTREFTVPLNDGKVADKEMPWFLNYELVSQSANSIWLDNIQIEVVSAQSENKEANLPSRNLFPNGSFERGIGMWNYCFSGNPFDEGGVCRAGSATIDTSTSTEGSSSLRFEVPAGKMAANWLRLPYYDGSAGGGTLAHHISIQPELGDYTFSFWAKAEPTQGIQPEIGLQVYSPALSYGVFKPKGDWSRYSYTFVNTSNKPFGFCLRFTPGVFWLDGIQVEKGKTMTAYAPDALLDVGIDRTQLYPIYVEGESATGILYTCSRLPGQETLRLSWRVLDYRNQIVEQKEEDVTLTPASTISRTIPLPSARRGSFRVEITLREPKSGQSAESLFLYAVAPKPKVIDPELSWFGIHDGRLYDKALFLRGGTIDDVYKFLSRLGCRWDRSFELGAWAWHEPAEGKWRWMDGIVNAAQANGIKILPILGNTVRSNGDDMPEWAWSKKAVPPKPNFGSYGNTLPYYPRLEAWSNFVSKFVRHYGDRIDAVEIMNETGNMEPDEYVSFTKAAKEAIMSVNPKVRVVAPASPAIPYSHNSTPWIAKVLDADVMNWVDVYSGHFYRYASIVSPEENNQERTLENQMSYLRTLKVPVWDTETSTWGKSQYAWISGEVQNAGATTPRHQAEWFVRDSIMKMGAGIQRIFFHSLGGGLTNSMVHELVEPGFSPRPLTIAYAQLASQLDGAVFKKRLRSDVETYVYGFEEKGQPVVAYWNPKAKDDGIIQLPDTAADNIEAEDLMGNSISLRGEPKSLDLPLSQGVVYLRARHLSLDDLLSRFERAVVKGIPARITVGLGQKDGMPAVAVAVSNLSDAPLNGEIKLAALPANWKTKTAAMPLPTLAVNQSGVSFFPLAELPRPVLNAQLKASLMTGDTLFESLRTCAIAQAAKGNGTITLDGEIKDGEYGAAPVIVAGAPNMRMVARVAWQSDALLIGISVVDATAVSDKSILSGDCVEVYFDTAPTEQMFEKTYNNHRGKIIVACASTADGNSVAARVETKTCLGYNTGKINHVILPKVQAVGRRTARQYIIEMKIPFEDLQLAKGSVIGFNIGLIDYDGHDRNQWTWTTGGALDWWERPLGGGYLILMP